MTAEFRVTAEDLVRYQSAVAEWFKNREKNSAKVYGESLDAIAKAYNDHGNPIPKEVIAAIKNNYMECWNHEDIRNCPKILDVLNLTTRPDETADNAGPV